jgi:hypothetical protein
MPPPEFGDERLPDRFWDKASPEPNTGCWLWTGATVPSGYGQFGIAASKAARAHRVAYAALVGPPSGPELDHRCRTRCCVNPAHLDPVSHLENMRRSAPAVATHCKRGHEYGVPGNVSRRRKPGKVCLVCVRLQWHAVYKTRYPRKRKANA